jgi:hypothetical protein
MLLGHLRRLRDPTLAQVEFRTVIMYSTPRAGLPGVGTGKAMLVAEAESTHMVWLLVVFFAVFEFGSVVVATTSLLGRPPVNVAIRNSSPRWAWASISGRSTPNSGRSCTPIRWAAPATTRW